MTNLELAKEQGNQAAPNIIDAAKAEELELDITLAKEQGNQAGPNLLEASADLLEPEDLELARQQGNQCMPLLVDKLAGDEPTVFLPYLPHYFNEIYGVSLGCKYNFAAFCEQVYEDDDLYTIVRAVLFIDVVSGFNLEVKINNIAAREVQYNGNFITDEVLQEFETVYLAYKEKDCNNFDEFWSYVNHYKNSTICFIEASFEGDVTNEQYCDIIVTTESDETSYRLSMGINNPDNCCHTDYMGSFAPYSLIPIGDSGYYCFTTNPAIRESEEGYNEVQVYLTGRYTSDKVTVSACGVTYDHGYPGTQVTQEFIDTFFTEYCPIEHPELHSVEINTFKAWLQREITLFAKDNNTPAFRDIAFDIPSNACENVQIVAKCKDIEYTSNTVPNELSTCNEIAL